MSKITIDCHKQEKVNIYNSLLAGDVFRFVENGNLHLLAFDREYHDKYYAVRFFDGRMVKINEGNKMVYPVTGKITLKIG